MEDAFLLASLPDDVNELKRLLVAREEQHQVAIAGHEAILTEHENTIASQQSAIATLTKQRDEYYVEKLRLEVQLAKALKQAYGPRADRVRDLGQSLRARRGRNQVDVVGHEAVPLNRQSVALRLLAEQFQVNVVIVRDEEDILAVVAALGDVVRKTGQHDAGDAWPGRTLPGTKRGVKKYVRNR